MKIIPEKSKSSRASIKSKNRKKNSGRRTPGVSGQEIIQPVKQWIRSAIGNHD
jgi:hypothetical protein